MKGHLPRLMSSLFYPASLGTGLVWFLTAAFTRGLPSSLWSYDMALAIWLLVYFTLSYAILTALIDTPPHGAAYTRLSFFLDLAEVVIIFVCFYQLGLVVSFPEPAFTKFFLTLSVVPILQSFWNASIGTADRVLYAFSGVTFGVLITQGIWLWLPEPLVVLGMFGLLAYYWWRRFSGAA